MDLEALIRLKRTIHAIGFDDAPFTQRASEPVAVAEGATVAITARRSDRLNDLAKRITEQGGKVLSITADVSDEAQINVMVQKTQAEFGRVDILVNNAGVMLLGTIDGANTEDWRRMINLNVLGLMYATHKVLPLT